MSALLKNLLHFTRLLGDLGLDVQATRALDIAEALEYVKIGRRRDFYHALRCLLVHRPQDIPVFDEAFQRFWRRPPGDPTTQEIRAMGTHRRTGTPQIVAPVTEPNDSAKPEGSTSTIKVERVAALSYSERETLGTKDFARFTSDEIEQAKRVMAQLRWHFGVRRTRRWKVGRGRVPDLRRVIRNNLKHGNELIEIPTRQRAVRRRPLVLLCDVSGSMERYTRMLLYFVHCVAGWNDRVEVFLFATQLTRITRHLRRRTADEVVARATGRVPDFAGGTRIGDTLSAFNRSWARRILGHGSVILLISDGWDRGNPLQLTTEIARLQRTAHRLIWLNPLLGSPDYAPLTRGMRAALPFVDDFLPAHNLVSLETLAAHLNALPDRRPLRRHARVPQPPTQGNRR